MKATGGQLPVKCERRAPRRASSSEHEWWPLPGLREAEWIGLLFPASPSTVCGLLPQGVNDPLSYFPRMQPRLTWPLFSQGDPGPEGPRGLAGEVGNKGAKASGHGWVVTEATCPPAGGAAPGAPALHPSDPAWGPLWSGLRASWRAAQPRLAHVHSESLKRLVPLPSREIAVCLDPEVPRGLSESLGNKSVAERQGGPMALGPRPLAAL